jgi:transposase
MLDADLRRAIYRLHSEGMELRKIARQLHVSRNTVREIIKEGGNLAVSRRDDRITVDKELLTELYTKCDGWVQRVHELIQERGIEIGYSTLTRLIREYELGKQVRSRCGHVDDVPGAEMQHDTSPYKIKIAGVVTQVTASCLYFRFCKHRYLKFYRPFTRFEMKCFFYEALLHFGCCCKICVIDNTNLAVLRGTGANAVFVPEMINFADRFGFRWFAHEKGHSDRKAGEERSFWTVETNFFPGREFSSWENLNEQAKSWSTEILAKRAQTDFKIIPNEWFEREKPHLKKLPPYISEPYEDHERDTDQYGYIAFHANYYWVPGTKRNLVKVLQFSNRIRIYQLRELLIEYPLAPRGVKNERFKPPGTPTEPCHRKQTAVIEEQKIRNTVPELGPYLDFALKELLPAARNRFLRQLLTLQSRMPKSLFTQTCERAFKYKVSDPRVIERIAIHMLRDSLCEIPMPSTENEFANRETYLAGRLSAPPDLTAYEGLLSIDQEEKTNE